MEEDLPDIPYTPMRDINDQPAGPSSSPTGKVKEIGKQDIQYLISGSPDQKRARVLTAAEKKARYRANRSAALKAEELKRRKEARQNQTQEEKNTAKEKQKAGMKNLRDNQTAEEKVAAKEKDRVAKKNLRDNQTPEEKATANAKNVEQVQKHRENQTAQKKETVKAADRKRKDQKHSDVHFGLAFQSKIEANFPLWQPGQNANENAL